MADTTLISYAFSDSLWIRCTTRGSFVNSPSLKSTAEKYLSAGGKDIVVDLEMCPGVDSTFMGTLAGLSRQAQAAGGCICVAGATARTRSAMESLGLDMLLHIDPEQAAWRQDIEERRETLKKHGKAGIEPSGKMSEIERTKHVLAAHNTLRSMNAKNSETFGYVCETLEEDLMRRHDDQDEF